MAGGGGGSGILNGGTLISFPHCGPSWKKLSRCLSASVGGREM